MHSKHNLAGCRDSAGDWSEAQTVIQWEWENSVYLPAVIYKQTITGSFIRVGVF